MSSLVSVNSLPRFFWFVLGADVECRVQSSDSGVMCSAQMNAVGSVLSLLNSEMSSRPLISARLRAAARPVPGPLCRGAWIGWEEVRIASIGLGRV